MKRGRRISGLRSTAAAAAVASTAAALLCACAVGPDFRSPAAPRVTGYLAEPMPQTIGQSVGEPEGRTPAQTPGQGVGQSASQAVEEGQDVAAGQTSSQTMAQPPTQGTDSGASGAARVQRLAAGMDIPAQWWSVFHSPGLDKLVKQALEHNPNVRVARATLRQAQEEVAAQRGSFLPQVAASYSFNRQRDATGTLSPTLTSGESIFNLHTAQVSVSYVFDVFGQNRRQVESLQALADAQRFQAEATYLSLASNVVAAAIEEASLRAQVAATNEMVRGQREELGIVRRQYELGAVANTEVLAQQSALSGTEATLPALQKQLAQQRHLLSALTGRFPDDEPAERFELSDIELPMDLPVSLPAALVRQRPDVLSAEAQMHSASAQVGVAIANLLPQISLTASMGGASTLPERLFASGNTFWSAGASLTQTLFAGGTLLHRKRAADAALDAAGAQYRAVVLAAFQNVADALTALQYDAEAVVEFSAAEQAAGQSLNAARHNVDLGLLGYLAVLAAEQAQQQAALNLAQARANRYADTAALLQALGGGWWNRA